MKHVLIRWLIGAIGSMALVFSATAPKPSSALPSPSQLRWHQLEFYGFLHFGMNTFTDKEWGYGDESERLFNPTALDARQWARVARDAGMRGLIITAKHHDGFCLWPSRFTEHSVKNSPWKNGQGDVLKELANACLEYGLKFGVYLSPWDRNRADYATPAYLEYYRGQLREILSHYGPVFEVWFDGANGGDGFYGGARERRRIDASAYYDWPATWSIVRELQPQAVMFSDAGPDVRWVGNERGTAFENEWMTLNRGGLYPGFPRYHEFAPGQPDGSDWVPPEVDVSIRPGWFYHPKEKPKSVRQLLDIYYQSVGRSANLLLNIPPDTRGLIPELDASRLIEFRRILDETFKTDLARQAVAVSSQQRARDPKFSAQAVNDGRPDTYWATDDGVTNATLELRWREPRRFDRVVLQEFIALGQRISSWRLEAQTTHSEYRLVARGQTVGYKRIARFEPVTARRLRLDIDQAKASPTLSTLAVFLSCPSERGPE